MHLYRYHSKSGNLPTLERERNRAKKRLLLFLQVTIVCENVCALMHAYMYVSIHFVMSIGTCVSVRFYVHVSVFVIQVYRMHVNLVCTMHVYFHVCIHACMYACMYVS